MSTARSTLERLSSEPDTQLLAEQREMAQIAWQHTMASAYEEGEAKGHRHTVRMLCEVLEIELDDNKQRMLEALSIEQLAALVNRIKSERKWPDGV
ncbi:MAG: hypothetical protein QM784_08035 [Polyangiaceae bacterium]